jgi:pimeloyl-ACP methyl ester carboxylesterase
MGAIEALGLPESRWAEADGPVHYREWPGPDEGPTFVLVHGLGGSMLNWSGVAPGLSRFGRVLALDLAGFGLTPLHGRDARVFGHRRLVDGFLRNLDLPPVVLVGNSMGGMVSLLQGGRSPATVDRLVLVDAAFPRTALVASQFEPRVAALFAFYSLGRAGEGLLTRRARKMGAERLVRETLDVCSPHPERIDPVLVDALIEQTKERESFEYAMPAFMAAARSIFRAQVRPGRYRELVQRLRRPALVLHGEQDRLVPVDLARAAAAEHPNWRLVVYPDLGHVPQMEDPARWLDDVAAWLEADRAPTSPRPSGGP